MVDEHAMEVDTVPDDNPTTTETPEDQSQPQQGTSSENEVKRTEKDSSDKPAADLPSKRFSPWRQPKDDRDPESAASLKWSGRKTSKGDNSKSDTMKSRLMKSKERARRKLLQDSFVVQIPLHVTADLGLAMRRKRRKRVEGLLAEFPHLNKKKTSSDDDKKPIDDDDEDAKDDDGKDETTNDDKKDNSDANSRKKDGKKKERLTNQPQPGDFGNIVDYLEAKYVQGVMVDDSDPEDEGDEGQGSVYSETSFLDDTDLQRTVAEQVLAQTTTTKLELRDDDEFFVNVGKLEVEETDLTKAEYDPLKDAKSPPPKRKRKKPEETSGDGGTTAPTSKKPKQSESSKTSTTSKTKTPPTNSNKKEKEPTKSKKEEGKKEESKKEASKNPTLELLQKRSDGLRNKYEDLYDIVVDLIKSATADELPRRKTIGTVSIKCPAEKRPGDSVTFENPHVPGQKLKVKVPKTCKPGAHFKVTVPVPTPEEDDVDHNRLTRTFYDSLDDYARAFDDWCEAEGEYRKEIKDKEFSAHFEKRTKFDQMTNEFPKDLKTPIDKDYLKKILRRARQNRSKREQTLARQEGTAAANAAAQERSDLGDDSGDISVSNEPGLLTISVSLPDKAVEFPSKVFNRSDFSRKKSSNN